MSRRSLTAPRARPAGRRRRGGGGAPGHARATYGSGLAYAVLTSGASIAVGLASAIVTARLFKVDVIGAFALASAPVGATTFLSTLREQSALVRELSVLEVMDPRATALLVAVGTFSTALTVAVSLVASVITWALFTGPMNRAELLWPALAGIWAYALVTNPAWNIDMALTAFRAGRQLFVARLGQLVAYFAFAVAGSAISRGVWTLVLATAASWLVTLLYRLWILPRYLTLRVRREDLREGFARLGAMVRFGLRLAPSGYADGVTTQVGTWVLSASGSLAGLGAYNRAQLLGLRLSEANTRVGEMLFPTLVERRAARDRDGVDRAAASTLEWSLLLLLWPAAVGGGAASGIMAIFGEGFGAAGTALAILLVVPAVAAAYVALGYLLVAFDRPVASTWIAVARMLCTVVATVGLTLLLGVTGAALGLLLGYAAALPVVWREGSRHLTAPWRALWPLRRRAMLAATYGLAFAASAWLDARLDGALGVLVTLAAGSVVYAGAALALGAVGRDARERARGMLGRLRAGA